jgi:hypothetical protein
MTTGPESDLTVERYPVQYEQISKIVLVAIHSDFFWVTKEFQNSLVEHKK